MAPLVPVLIQRAKADWELVDLITDPSAWSKLDPTPIVALNVQGVEISGQDGYAVEALRDLSGGIRVTCWDSRVGQEWTFLPLQADPGLGGAINTKQALVETPVDKFSPPTTYILGSKPSDYEEYAAVQSQVGWRTWTVHLDPSELDAKGDLKDQREQGRYAATIGTRTYYYDTLARSHNSLAVIVFERAFLDIPSGAVTQNRSQPANLADLVWSFRTHEEAEGVAGEDRFWTLSEPDCPDWSPVSTTYRFQVDCTVAGGNITYGFDTIGPLLDKAEGRFQRVEKTSHAEQQSHVQAQAEFSGTGLKLATSAFNHNAGSRDNLWVALLAVANSSALNAQNMTLRLQGSDSFSDGPWPKVQQYRSGMGF